MPKFKEGDYFVWGDLGIVAYEIESVKISSYILKTRTTINNTEFSHSILHRDVQNSGYIKKSIYRKNNKLNRRLYPKAKVIDKNRIEVGYEI